VVVSARQRTRLEDWSWYDAVPPGRYSFLAVLSQVAIAQDRAAWRWRVDVAVPLLLGLPADAVQAAPAGQLGLGGSYAAASGGTSTATGVIVRQAFVEWRPVGGAMKVGRFEFSDGAERIPADAGLAAMKAQRIAQRLIGPFGFTHGQRSMDGLHAFVKIGASQVTIAAMRPTSGVFTVTRAGRSLPIDVGYASIVRGVRTQRSEVDGRLFGVWYDDNRELVSTDNRPQGVRAIDARGIEVATLGGHLVGVRRVGTTRLDALSWLAVQRGRWGTQSHRAKAYAVEAGVQRTSWPGAPWARVGAYASDGDVDAGDAAHGTFFQVLPTPRLYARFPFYNGMNIREQFATLAVTPRKTLTLRTGVHRLNLTQPSDLWYAGGGAFDDRAFGYVGRPTRGGRSLGAVVEGAVEWKPRRWLSAELFVGTNVRNDAAVQVASWTNGSRFSYAELTLSR